MADIVLQRDVGDLLKSALASAFTSVTAGGAGNAVAVVGSKIDRVDPATGSMADSCQLNVLWSAVLAATKTLAITAVKIEQSVDGVTWDATPYATFTDPGVVATGAGTVTGVTSINQNLRSAKRFIRFDWTPTLSNTTTDTSSLVGDVVLGGYDPSAGVGLNSYGALTGGHRSIGAMGDIPMSTTRVSHPVQTGTVGGTPIIAELKDGWAIVSVLLSANYARVHPPGFPIVPCGGEVSKVLTTGTVLSGVTRKFFAHEANALIAAGAGTAV